jgi:hypothetical protein
MATWTFQDGSKLATGGVVTGDGVAADHMGVLLHYPVVEVRVVPIPGPTVQLDRKSNFLLDYFANEVALAVKQTVTTDYDLRLDDAPPRVRKLIEEARRSVDHGEAPIGTVF